MDPSTIREKIVRFRILIIGRANAGKTTILQRVCNTGDNPEVFNSAGKKIDATVLKASRERGEHDIENEMVFRNNPGFVFHDSCGFEAGSESEYEKVNAFIAGRAKRTSLKDRIHTIWYCIPMDEDSRSFTEGEVKFFSHCDTGSIPVIVLFTKFDALYDIEFARLGENGASRQDAKELAPKHAEETFANGPQLKFLYNSKDIKRPPKCHVCLPDMDKDNADCRPLIECTAGTLDDEVLKQLFVSTQQTNLELCMKCAIEDTLKRLVASAELISFKRPMVNVGRWFPHIQEWSLESLEPIEAAMSEELYWGESNSALSLMEPRWWYEVTVSILLRARAMLIEAIAHRSQDRALKENLGVSHMRPDDLCGDQRAEMQSRILSAASGSSPFEKIVQFSSAAAIIFEHSFYIFDKRRYLQDQQRSVPSFLDALEQYMASSQAAAVREAVSTAVHTYQEAASSVIHKYESNPSTWKAKLPFEYFRRKAQRSLELSERKAELMKTILEITLQYRLPRP